MGREGRNGALCRSGLGRGPPRLLRDGEDGAVLAKRRIADSLLGIAELQELVAEHPTADEELVMGIEIDRGLS